MHAHPTQRPRNRLADASSPYLLQHATNPVDWYERGEDAFQKARERGVPIFLSIGYSTCYWCHVMERESFESEATARLMNERFVCIKLDREQRPDVDDLYMTATQIMTGRGGWPMSVFLEPRSLKPYYCGTYFPPSPRHGMPSFEQVLIGMSDAYREQRDEVIRQANAVGEAVREQLGEERPPSRIGPKQVQDAVGTLLKISDEHRGGFGSAPKFPQPCYIDLLIEVRQAADEATRVAIDRVVRTTLDQMMIGGIHDQIGGGFHRYSVDEEWTVPHFEKMLYDNAQLASTYAAAAEIYADSEYQRVMDRTLRFVSREMTNGSGGVCSAIDAEVDSREGLNYLWLPEEFDAALTPAESLLARRVFGLDASANFQDPHHPGEPPRHVLRLSARHDRLAEANGQTAEAWHEMLDRIGETLLRVRSARKQPHLDDKVIAAWSGMMIKAYADGFLRARDTSLLDAAFSAAAFVEREMLDIDGAEIVVRRSWRDERCDGSGVLEDSAHLVLGLVALHRAATVAGMDDRGVLDLAVRLGDAAIAAYQDPATGALFDTTAGRSDLFIRARSFYDGATPCAASAMINALIDLAEVTGESRFRDAAVGGLVALSGPIADSPVGTCNAVRALFRVLRSGWALEQLLDAAGARDVQPDDHPRDALPAVEIYADAERVSVRNGEPAAVQLVFKIPPGQHLIAARQSEQSGELVPLRIELHGGSGAVVFADYPDGSPLRLEDSELDLAVYTGDIEFPVLIERHGDVSGRLLLTATYQACTDTECQMPRTVELDVAIDID